jgi:serine/threonine-protein kinase
VHRDIKPANLFLAKLPNGQTRVKVLDFGLAKDLEVRRGVASDLTHEHAFLGSPMFMSPEQIRDPRGVDKRTDIWSLGTTLWQLITGEAPFTRSSVQATLADVCTKRLPPVSSVRPGVPRYVDDAIARCMHKDPEGRFSTVQELAAALDGPQRASERELAGVETTANPQTPRLPEPPMKAFQRTEPMPAPAAPAAPALPMTPRSSPTFVRPHPPPPPTSRSNPTVGLLIVAAISLLAIGALALTQFRPRSPGTPAPSRSVSVAVASAPPAPALSPSEDPPAASLAPIAPTPSASAIASTQHAPPAPPAASTAPRVMPKASSRRPSPSASAPAKDPYDR